MCVLLQPAGLPAEARRHAPWVLPASPQSRATDVRMAGACRRLLLVSPLHAGFWSSISWLCNLFLGGLGGGCMSVSLCVSYVHGKGRHEELKDNGLIQVINKNQKFINIWAGFLQLVFKLNPQLILQEHLWTAVLPTSVFMVQSCLLYRAAAGANHHIWCPAWGRLVSCRAPTIPWSFSSVFSVQFWLTSFASAN